MMRRHGVWRRRRVSVGSILIFGAIFAGIGLLILNLRTVHDDSPTTTSRDFRVEIHDSVSISESESESESESGAGAGAGAGAGVGVESETRSSESKSKRKSRSCASVEEMGKEFEGGFWDESFRVRKLIQNHFELNGASRVRNLPPQQFCQHGFVLGKSAEAGFGNEMYKILSGAALSVMLNRSLIIGQTRHIIGSFSSLSFFVFNIFISKSAELFEEAVIVAYR